MQRRSALQWFGAVSATSLFNPTELLKSVEESYLKSLSNLSDLHAAGIDEEDFWLQIRQAYSVSPSIINLNNGGVSPQPRVVQEAVEYYNRLSNEAPSYYMWRILDQGREPLREKMAALAGCSAEELAFNRNSSEALETVIFGLHLKAGDEVVLTKQDYPNMINAYKQRAHREGIVLKWVNFDFPIEDDKKIVDAFEAAFTEKTKVVHITHMINWNGQLLPSKKIADVAHARGIEVVVDGAHSFAHIPFKIPDLGADYFGASLHKWMSAPFGSGLLYIKKDKIKNIYPLLAAADPESDDIRKFESLGTRSFAIEHAISHAIDFYEMIGQERKFNRLYELQQYWTNKVKHHPRVIINHPQHKNYSGALGNMGIKDKKPDDLATYLFDNYKIHVVAINWENIHGIRITPNVYTTKSELDKLVKGILKFADDRG